MGSYGARPLQCTWCGKWGKCLVRPLPIGTPSLIDVDGIGVLCDPCFDRQHPPHYDWFENMLKRKIDKESVSTITEYAYQPCADYKKSLQHCAERFRLGVTPESDEIGPADPGPQNGSSAPATRGSSPRARARAHLQPAAVAYDQPRHRR